MAQERSTSDCNRLRVLLPAPSSRLGWTQARHACRRRPEIAVRRGLRRLRRATESYGPVERSIALSSALLVWGIGGLIALSGAFERAYVESWSAYFGAFACAWSLYWYLWAVGNVPIMVRASTIALDAGSSWRAFAMRGRRRIERPVPVRALGIFVAFAAYLLLHTAISHGVGPIPGLSHTTSVTWLSRDHIWFTDGIVLVWASVVLPSMLGAATLAVRYFRVVHEFAEFGRGGKFVESLPLAREGCRRISRFAWVGGAAWTLGAVCIAVSLAISSSVEWLPSTTSIVSGTIVLGISAFGVAGMAWPETILHGTLVRARRIQLDRLAESFKGGRAEDDSLRTQISELDAESVYVHPFGGVFQILSGLIVPIAIFALTLAVQAPANASTQHQTRATPNAVLRLQE